ncbi:MAG TPA: phosphoglycerate mutase family protein [Solirubrobacteraceae bacterium]|nr:phosphoglycerate mutase family protein [Solirubrobacteraceae bacterium]
MARQLWLLRHADAEPHGTRPDSDRRLTPRGERQSRAAGRALARMGVTFDAALASPKERALRTAALALEVWGEDDQADNTPPPELELHEPLRSGFDARDALALLAGLDGGGRVLAVGHEPDLSGVVAALTGARIDLKKGGLAVVSSAGAAGELVLLLRPAELALIAGLAPVES